MNHKFTFNGFSINGRHSGIRLGVQGVHKGHFMGKRVVQREDILKILRIFLSIAGVVFASFILITQSFELMPYMLLVLGMSTLFTGVSELQKDKKAFWGYMSIIVSLFVFFVSILGFLLN